MKKILILILIFTFLLQYGFCQSEEDTTKASNNQHKIGIGAGITTGLGVSYKYIPSNFGIQVTVLFIPNSCILNYQGIGLTFLYYLEKKGETMLFLYQGNSYSNMYNMGIKCCPEVWAHFYNGIGFGVELNLSEKLSFEIMGGTGFYRNFDAFTITVETGLYYKIK